MISSQKIVLITGANQGIGFETAKNLLLASPTYHILLGSRDIQKGSEAIDVTDDSSVDAAAALVSSTYSRLDILVNNAGFISKNPSERTAFQEILAVNCVGTLSVTEAFIPLLRKSVEPRLVFVSSSMGSITHAADPNSIYFNPSGTQYRASKAALNMMMVQYHNRLGVDGFKVSSADPGLVVSNLFDIEAVKKRGALPTEVGGERVATVVRGERDEDLGKVCGEYGVSLW